MAVVTQYTSLSQTPAHSGHQSRADLSLPLSGAEAQCLSVLGDCAFGLVLCAIGERRLNLNSDFDFGVWVGSKYRNNFFGDLHVFGEGNPSPAIVTFTTEVATMAVNELLHRLQGYGGHDGAITTQVRQFHRMEDFRPGAKRRPGCPICDDAGYWGRGDMDPFLDRS